jgi:hypothetical protein
MNAQTIHGLPVSRLAVGVLIFMVLPAALWLGWRNIFNRESHAAGPTAADVASDNVTATSSNETTTPNIDVPPQTPSLTVANTAIPGPPGTKREFASAQGPYEIEVYLDKGATAEASAKSHMAALKAAGLAVELSPASTAEGAVAQIVYFVRGRGRTGTVVVVWDEQSGVTTTVMSTPEERE